MNRSNNKYLCNKITAITHPFYKSECSQLGAGTIIIIIIMADTNKSTPPTKPVEEMTEQGRFLKRSVGTTIMKTNNNKVIIDLTHYSTATKEATTAINTPERPSLNNKRVRVSRRIAALKEHHGVVANKEKEKVLDDDGTTRPQYYEQASSSGDDDGNHTNGYFEVDEILDRRTRKYGSESAGVRYVVEYCKFVCVHVVWCW